MANISAPSFQEGALLSEKESWDVVTKSGCREKDGIKTDGRGE
jgi:hypothetical protein